MALVRAQHHQQCVQVLRLADAFARQHLHQLLTLLGLPVVVVDLGVDITRADGIDVDAKFAPLHRKCFRHLDHCRLAHAVHANLWQHFEARHRRDIDDAPAGVVAGGRALGAGQHALSHFLRDKESASDVGVENKVEVVSVHVLQPLRAANAGVVDQNVNRADLGFGTGYCRLDGALVGHVQLDHMGITPLAFYLGAQLLEFFYPTARQHHRRARA